MKKQAKIVFTIDGDGNITADGIDFKGPVCHDLIKKYLDSLGMEGSVNKKPAFYEAAIRKNKNEATI